MTQYRPSGSDKPLKSDYAKHEKQVNKETLNIGLFSYFLL